MINVTPIYVGNGDTFQTWLARTNTIINIISSNAVTADSTVNGSFTSGNVYVEGSFAANTVAMTTLRGGNVQSATVLTVTGNVNFDSNTLFIDATNNRLGIGTGAPAVALTVNGAATAINLAANAITSNHANVAAVLTVANASVNNFSVNATGLFTVNAVSTFVNTVSFTSNVGFTVIPELPASDPTSNNQAVRKAYADTKLASNGGILTGNLTVNTASPQIAIQFAASGQAANLVSRLGANNRWLIQLGDGATESGSNTGSDFAIRSYTDAGLTLHTPISINRANGRVTIARSLNVTGPSYSSVSDLGTTSGTITIDMSTSNYFTVTLNGTATFANPTNPSPGQSGAIFVVQDGTGNRTASWGTNWDWENGNAPVLSTLPNAVDVIFYVVRTSSSIIGQILNGVS